MLVCTRQLPPIFTVLRWPPLLFRGMIAARWVQNRRRIPCFSIVHQYVLPCTSTLIPFTLVPPSYTSVDSEGIPLPPIEELIFVSWVKIPVLMGLVLERRHVAPNLSSVARRCRTPLLVGSVYFLWFRLFQWIVNLWAVLGPPHFETIVLALNQSNQ